MLVCSIAVSPQFTVGEGKGPIHFTNFMCNGTEQSIIECSFQSVELYASTCDHSRDIHLACRGEAIIICSIAKGLSSAPKILITDPIFGSSTGSLIVVAYTLIPVVLLLAGSVVTVGIVIFFLKCRSKDQDQQPR